MTRSDEMDALAERVEKLTGADREVDADIARAIGALGRFAGWPNKGLVSPELSIVPKYTSSLDAAMSLVPEGYSFHLNSGAHMGATRCYLCPAGPDSGGVADPRTVEGAAPLGNYAQAITAACLRAHASIIREVGRSEGERLHEQFDGNGRDRRNGGFCS